MRAAKARRVYWPEESYKTDPDVRLPFSFEKTQPGVYLTDEGEDEPTLVRWAWPAAGALIVGLFVGHWWRSRPKNVAAVGADELRRASGEMVGFDVLGAAP